MIKVRTCDGSASANISCKGKKRLVLPNAEGAAFSGIPGAIDRAEERTELLFGEDSVFDGLSVGCVGIGFLRKFVYLSAAVFACFVLGFSEGGLKSLNDVEFGVRRDRFNKVKASEGVSGGVDGNLGDVKSTVKNVGMLADGGDGAEAHVVGSSGKEGMPPAFLVFFVRGVFGRLGILVIGVVTLSVLVGLAARAGLGGERKGEGEEK